MDDLRLKELQLEFGLLKQKWTTAKSMPERQDLLDRILEILEESNWIVQQSLQQRFAERTDVAQQTSDACADAPTGKVRQREG
jgi:hypothetical protein